MGEYDISQWRPAGTEIHTPSDPKMDTGIRTGFITGVHAWCVVLHVRCPWGLGSCSPVAQSVSCVCRVVGHLADVHQYARLVCCVACAVPLATWLLFTGVHTQCSVCAVSLATWLLLTGVTAR